MKTLTFELAKDIFTEYALSSEEMIYVRGGDGDTEPPTPQPNMPPVII